MITVTGMGTTIITIEYGLSPPLPTTRKCPCWRRQES
jgi:hypothetical protein